MKPIAPVPAERPLTPSAAGRAALASLFLVVAACATARAAPPARDAAPYCWEALTEGIGPQDTATASVAPSIAAQGSHLWLAWSEDDDLQVRQWIGRRWVKAPVPKGRFPVIRVSSGGDVYLAWAAAENGQSNIHVGRWDGKKWQPVGAPLSAYPEPTTNAGNAAMVLDGKGRPVVAWQEATGIGPRSLHVARWDGRQWLTLGKAVATGSDIYSLEPFVAVDPGDSVLVAWNGGKKGRSFVRVARWAGTGWQDLGNTADGSLGRADDVRGPQLLPLADGRMLVAWLESGARRGSLAYSVWTGTRWEKPETVTGAAAGRRSWLPAVARLSDGTPLLGWPREDASDFFSVYARRWAAGSWQPVLDGLHLDPGPSSAGNVALAPGPDGGFFAAWDEPDRGDRRTRVVRAWPCAAPERQAVAPKRPRSSYWPKTVDAAVADILATMDEKSKARVRSTPRKDLVRFHLGWGTGIRNDFGLWAGNAALLESCGGKRMHPDDCSMIIIERVWERLQAAPAAVAR